MLFKKFYTWLIIGLMKILTYRPTSGSSYMNLPVKLRSQKKALINIKNKDQKWFLWCHVRHINPSKKHPERIRKVDKKLVKHITNPENITQGDKKLISYLDYDGIEFPMQEKILVNWSKKQYLHQCVWLRKWTGFSNFCFR